jgi:endonuclease/exonuclease/phosphatase family metal-dependent hydrolase
MPRTSASSRSSAQLGRPGSLALGVFVALGGCAALNHAPPRDPSMEPHLAPGAPAPAASGLRVVTYNVHGISGGAIARALRSDPALAGADVVLMQEVSSFGPCSAACAAGEELGLASLFAPGHQQDGGTSGVAILSRWPLRDPQVIELPYRHAVMNSARRIALAATIDTAEGPLRLIAVHLENRINPAARVSQLAPALAHARAFEGAVILGGDMNTSPFLWLGHLLPIPAGLQGRRLDAAARAAGLETPVADVAATSQWLDMRLDAIYTRGVTTSAHGVAVAVRASDHLPLWMQAKVTPPRQPVAEH